MPTDSLYLDGIELWTRIGVPDEERQAEQKIIVSVEFFLDLKPVAEKDDVRRGIDYAEVVKEVRALAATERKTLERLAEDIAAMLLERFTPPSVKVVAWKTPLAGMRAAAVTIVRP